MLLLPHSSPPPQHKHVYIRICRDSFLAPGGGHLRCVGATPLRISHAKCACLSSRANAEILVFTPISTTPFTLTTQRTTTSITTSVKKLIGFKGLRPFATALTCNAPSVVDTKAQRKRHVSPSVTNVPATLLAPSGVHCGNNNASLMSFPRSETYSKRCFSYTPSPLRLEGFGATPLSFSPHTYTKSTTNAHICATYVIFHIISLPFNSF